jgi:ATP-dependent helicase/DNAse subunit B
MGRVPLTLVTGPANAEKARVALDAYRAAIAQEPILVVPTAADADHYRRELASGGLVFGSQVIGFRQLVREIASRAGTVAAPLGEAQRERVVAAAVAGLELEALGASAAMPGFARAAATFIGELEEARTEPQRLTRALRDWAGSDSRRRRYVDDVAAIYAAYRRRLARLGRPDGELHAAAALDALRLDPARWGRTPVVFYGFDDLSPVQVDAVDTLARVVDANVTVSLPHEPGRIAFAGRATTVEELAPTTASGGGARGDRLIRLDARPEHYSEGARAALHHLERHLFETDAPRVAAGDAVALVEGGGERAELELVAARVAGLLAGGVPAEEIAVVMRASGAAAALLEEVFGAVGVPLSFERRVPLGHTSLGRGLVALVRCALLDGSAGDLLTWLRTPGVLRKPELADVLEEAVRTQGIATAVAARAAWERLGFFPLEALDRVRAANERGPERLLERLGDEVAALFAAPFRRRAALLDDAERGDARVLATARRALDELRELAAADRSLAPSAVELVSTLSDLEVTVGERAGRGRVAVVDPLAIRARRVRALFLCRLQEGTFPPPARPDPFFSDEERREIAIATGLRLPGGRDLLGAERYLFYAAVSRPTDLLCLSWHTADDDGGSAVPSFFVADVADLFTAALHERRERRELGEVCWPHGAAPTAREAARSAAASGPRAEPALIAPLTDRAVLTALAEKRSWSASSLETWAGCPVRWFVERFLRARTLGPDPEPMVRGALAHRVLEEVFQALGEPLRPSSLPAARRALADALAQHETAHPISPNAQRMRAAVRRLQAHLERYLEHAAHSGSVLLPSRFEVSFGGPDDELGALELAGGELRLGGRIDRVDIGADGSTAVVVDYKSGAKVPAAAKWVEERAFQAALYLLVVREVLRLDPVGTLYQPLGGADLRAGGALLADADPTFDAAAGVRMERDAFDALVDAVVQAALTALREIRAGALEPRPDTCGYRKSGCQYPGFCRCEAP